MLCRLRPKMREDQIIEEPYSLRGPSWLCLWSRKRSIHARELSESGARALSEMPNTVAAAAVLVLIMDGGCNGKKGNVRRLFFLF